jgi:hypothetical protein
MFGCAEICRTSAFFMELGAELHRTPLCGRALSAQNELRCFDDMQECGEVCCLVPRRGAVWQPRRCAETAAVGTQGNHPTAPRVSADPAVHLSPPGPSVLWNEQPQAGVACLVRRCSACQ